MNFLCYSDLQAHDGSDRCYHDPTIPLQRWRVQQFYEKLQTTQALCQFGGIVDLGDTFDRRDAIAVPTIDAVLAGLEIHAATRSSNWKLQGNHDQHQKYNTRVHNGRIFHRFFNVVDDILTVSSMHGTGMVMAAFPPSGDSDFVPRLKAAVRNARAQHDRVIVLGHFTVIGAQLNSGLASEGIPISVIEDADLVLLGDIHKPQSLAEHIHYVGSPFQQNFGESGEEKRMALLNVSKATVKWLPLTGFPRYIQCDLSTFLQQVKSDSEDRYRVTLYSHAEAEKFSAHPLSVRAEAVYNYESESSAVVPQTEWTSSSAMQRWVEKFPPKERGIPLTSAEMLSYGEEIAAQ